ncbi:hypothetical protein G7046_g6174 [Stylonectria norvegica]|nr:hypothetical protein G7046_g6174 [Stylonectria norvegica]
MSTTQKGQNNPQDEPVIIVGAGVFGLSLAYELAAVRGYTKVTVLDRYMPPVPDGSSVDVSRIIRSEYADPLYASLAVDALAEWRTPDWASQYHESGFLMLARGSDDNSYVAKYRAMRERQKAKQPMEIFDANESEAKIKRLYPGVQADLKETSVLRNTIGGWANATEAIRGLAARCSLVGVSFVTGAHGTVLSLNRSGSRVTGVQTAAGTSLSAASVVLATGAWTNTLMPGMTHNLLSVGQPVGFIQLSAEEARRLSKMPVMIDTNTGVFCFPPTPDTHQLKLARHGFGFTTQITTDGGRVVSAPRLDGNNATSGYLPSDAEQALREGARKFFPEFGDRDWVKLRLCWYTDTPAGDFVVDHHPEIEGLFFATGGSGHAFKFLPIIGRHVADCFQGKAARSLREKWAIRPSNLGSSGVMSGDGSPAGPAVRVLTQKEQAKL